MLFIKKNYHDELAFHSNCHVLSITLKKQLIMPHCFITEYSSFENNDRNSIEPYVNDYSKFVWDNLNLEQA